MALTKINKAGLDEIALDHVFTIGASGSSAYTFQGEGLNGTVNNPTLYLTRGKTYRFENGSGGHPIRIQSTAGASGTAYNTGVTNNAGSGTVIVEVQHDAPDVLYYQCTSHAAMNGILYITGALADGGVTTAKLAADAVNGTKIADNAVAAEHIAANAVGSSELANNAVGTNEILDGAVAEAKIGTNAVTSAKIADQAVTLAKLPHGTSSNDGKFLRANNGADPSFETVSIPAGTTINNNADNRVITGSGTANTLNGESGLIFDGTNLGVGITPDSHNASVKSLQIGTVTNLFNETSDDYTILGNNIYFHSGGTNKRIKAQECSRIMMNAGEFVFERAGADSADSNITFTRHFKIDANGNAFVENPSEARLQVKTPSNGIIALRADGSNTQLGTWSNHDLKIVRNSTIKASITANGLCFNSDTAAANAISDYEEGTFTPTIPLGGSSISYTIQRGSYTKIGDLVEFQIDLYLSGTADGNTLRIGGLPFTAANQTTYAFGGAFLNYSNAAFGSLHVVFHIPSQNTIIHMYNSETGNVIAGTSSGVALFNNKEICLTGVYKAA